MTTAAPWEGRNVVYRVYNDAGACLYVGCTRNLTGRMYGHQTGRERAQWADHFARIRVTIHEDRYAALEVEQSEIKRLRPRYNIYGRGKRWTWQASDFVEVIAAMRYREANGIGRTGTAGLASWPATAYNVAGLEREFTKRYPCIAGLVLGSVGVERTA